jgi:uncharacterized protein YqgV (UPF0045/DUF77 family)
MYPLRQEKLSPSIDRTLRILREHGLEVSTGAMSTVVSGDDTLLFDAIKKAFVASAADGDIVMVVTFSNACPITA